MPAFFPRGFKGFPPCLPQRLLPLAGRHTEKKGVISF